MPPGTITNIYNICDYGAIGDGVTNCTYAIQACIDDARDGVGFDGGTVYIPPGKFLLESTIVISGRTKLKVISDGEFYFDISIDVCVPVIYIVGCSYCQFQGLKFKAIVRNPNDDPRGIPIVIASDYVGRRTSCMNTFKDTRGDGLRNYLFVVLNGNENDLNPYDNTLDGIGFDGCYGVLKDMCEDPYAIGRGINIMNVDGYSSDASNPYFSNDNFPAMFWFKNVHDIYINNVTGEHKYSDFLIEGDSNAHLHHIQVSSYFNNSIIVRRDPDHENNGGILTAINLTDSYFFGMPYNDQGIHYAPNSALDVSGCRAFNASGLIIENYHRGIIQRDNGYYVYRNIRFLDCIVDVEFGDTFYWYNTFVFLEGVYSDIDWIDASRPGANQATVFYSDPLNETLERVVAKAFDSWLQAKRIFDLPANNRIELVHCRLVEQGTVASSKIAKKFPEFAESSPSPPTTYYYNVGDIIFKSNPAPGGKIGWVCTSAGNPGTWKAFGLIDI